MSMSVKDVLQQTDWKLFREQKGELSNIRILTDEQQDAVAGIINFIDALQDAVVEEGTATEQQVFGDLNDDN